MSAIKNNTINSVHIIFRPTNREQKRKMLAEYKRNAIRIAKIESAFLEQLFFGFHEYSELYYHYLAQFDALFPQLESKWTRPNENYFRDIFKPIEKL